MPPTPPTPPLPTNGRGEDALHLLESNGILPVVPPIRSSDYDLCLSNPSLYYLSRRMGIRPALSWSKALSRGSWFHYAFEMDDWENPDCNPTMNIQVLLASRLDELRELCAGLGIVNDGLKAVLQREERDALCACSWYKISSGLRISNDWPDGWRNTLRRSPWRLLCRESTLRMPVSDVLHAMGLPPSKYKIEVVAQPDAILYNETTNRVWILDLKTCEENPLERLVSCPLEFQAQHYFHVVRTLLLKRRIHPNVVPADALMGGVIHIAIQKPTIDFGRNDRDYRIVTRTLKSGPNKGEERTEKVYAEGEPKLSNYLARIEDWYHGRGDYLDMASLRESKPPVNVSYVPSCDFLDEDGISEYTDRLFFVASYATREPIPKNFPRPTSVRSFNRTSPYAPFYLSQPSVWPEIIKREGFIVAYRDEPLPPIQEILPHV